MAVYFWMILGLGACFTLNTYYEQKNRMCSQTGKPTKVTSVLIVAILALIAGLRYKVGADFDFYYLNYGYYKSADLKFLDEPGIRIIARIAKHIYDDPATMIFIAALITVSLMVITILKNSEMYWLSVLLYVFLGDWSGSFNGIRQYLAVAVLFAGHRYIKEKKLFHWLLTVVIATTFHITAIIGVFFYFYPRIKLSVKSIVVSVIAAYIGLNIYDRIFELIGLLKQDELILEGEKATYILNAINPLRIAVAWVPVAFFLVFMKYYDIKQEQFRFYMNMSILNACLMTTAMNSAYLGRVGSYTSAYNALVWPLLLKPIKKESRGIFIFVMLICYMLYWLTEMSKEDLSVFLWIFQR